MKKFALFALCTFLIMGLCACSAISRTPDEAMVLRDFNYALPELAFANLDKAEFIRQQTNKQEKRYVAEVMISGKDDYAEYNFTATLTYNYYDDKGWMLDNYDYASAGIKCYKGRNFDDVKKEIEDNCLSYFPGCSYIEVIDMSAELNTNTEIVTLNYEILNKHIVTYYENAKMYFVYADGKWQLNETVSEPDNCYINLEKTKWVTEGNLFVLGDNEFDIEITEIADDSSKIKLLYGGIETTATVKSDTGSILEHGFIQYQFDKPIEWIGVNNSKRMFYALSLNNLTQAEKNDVFLVLEGPNSIYFHLDGEAPEWWSYEDEVD